MLGSTGLAYWVQSSNAVEIKRNSNRGADARGRTIERAHVRPDVTTQVTGNTEQRVTQTRNCTATSGRRESTKLWFNAMEEKTGDKGSIGFLHNSTQQVVVTEIL